MSWIKKYFPYLIIAGVLIQTLFYKFSAHPESVLLFNKLHLLDFPESYGRIGVGVAELLVSIGLFIKPLRKLSIIAVVVLMSGALYFHITIIGFEKNNINLSILGLITFLIAGYLLLEKK